MSGHCAALAEFMVTALMPARRAAATWSRMRASRGEMITVGPDAGPSIDAAAEAVDAAADEDLGPGPGPAPGGSGAAAGVRPSRSRTVATK